MTDESDGLPRYRFACTAEPMPLIDPTEAARFLKINRHTLACYRNLNQGPAYYKFGRWVRYAWPDLRQWADVRQASGDLVDANGISLREEHDPKVLIDTLEAARFLTVTRHCLLNYRLLGNGPAIIQFGRRVYYAIDELHRWAEKQRHPLPGNPLCCGRGTRPYRRRVVAHANA